MKNITVSVDETVYHEARVEAAKRRTSLSALVRDFLVGLVRGEAAVAGQASPALAKLFAMSDKKHRRRAGSVGPLDREELHARGIPRH